MNQDELRSLLNVAKTIIFDTVQRRIHIVFFDRQTASRYEMATIPFRGALYRVSNMHPPVKGSVWARQLDTGGVRLAAQREYVVELHNVTRFTDIGRLTAYFEARLPRELSSMIWTHARPIPGRLLCGN